MNKKGFTLVELLATIIILGLLALIASTSVTKVIKDSKSDLYDSQIKLIKSAAESWGASNLHILPDSGECSYITIKNLQEYGILEQDIKNPKTNKNIDENIKIKITTKKTGYGNDVTNYEVNPDSVEGCFYALPCELAEDSTKEEKEIGAKYICEVSPGTKYNFYVLSYEDDGSINLIMDRNMCSDGTPTDATKSDNCSVKWNDTGSYDGPVDAMGYLYDATKTWTFIRALNYDYNDKEFHEGITSEEGFYYLSFVSNNGIAKITALDGTSVLLGTKQMPLRARMPIYTDREKNKSKSEISNATENTIFLYENLDGNAYYWYGSVPQPKNNISKIYGYWSLSSMTCNDKEYCRTDGAFGVYSTGNVSGNYILLEIDEPAFGIRPVINVKL